MQDGVEPALGPEFPMLLQSVLCQCVCLHARGPWCPHAGAGLPEEALRVGWLQSQKVHGPWEVPVRGEQPAWPGGQDLRTAHKGKCIEHYPGGLGPGLELIKYQDFSKFIFWRGHVVENRIITARPPRRALPPRARDRVGTLDAVSSSHCCRQNVTSTLILRTAVPEPLTLSPRGRPCPSCNRFPTRQPE